MKQTLVALTLATTSGRRNVGRLFTTIAALAALTGCGGRLYVDQHNNDLGLCIGITQESEKHGEQT